MYIYNPLSYVYKHNNDYIYPLIGGVLEVPCRTCLLTVMIIERKLSDFHYIKHIVKILMSK